VTERRPSPDWIEVDVAPSDGTDPEPAPAALPPAAVGRPISGRTVLVVALVAVLACSAAVVALVVRSRTITTRVHAQALAHRGVDAAGCPIGAQCQVSPNPEQDLVAVVDRALNHPAWTGGATVFDVPTALTFRSTLTALVGGGVTVAVAAQCVPRGAPVPARTDPLPAIGPVDAALVVPGEFGCSVAVVVHAPRGARVPVAAVEQIAHDGTAQLRAGR
jgi:hypothetical protein